MGWIRDLMAQRDPALSSFGVLARECLSDSRWPDEVRAKARSLAALFSKLDRGIELEWLADRRGVQRVLARVLDCPLSAVDAALSETLEVADEQIRRWRLPDAPLSRPLDLLSERLPPGLPREVSEPAHWDRVWWRCNADDGPSLVRRWLVARGWAQGIVAATWEDALSEWTGVLPAFIELEGPGPTDVPPELQLVCVASAQPAPTADWLECRNPDIGSALPNLVTWVGERLPQDGHFDAEVALAWLRKHALGTCASFEAVIGLCALIDELGTDQLAGAKLEALAQRTVERRLREAAEEGAAEAQWLMQHGYAALGGMAQRALVESDASWTASRTEEDWLELVPAEYQKSVDVEWARLSLTRAGAPLTADELQEALAKISPGAFRVVRALLSARILVAETGNHYRVAPMWLAAVLRQSAEQRLLDGAPQLWGEALLRPGVQTRLRDELLKRFRADDWQAGESVVEWCEEEGEEPAGPSGVAAVELVFECLGLSGLTGSAPASELSTSIIGLQARSSVELEGAHHPRLGHRARRDQGLWYLAALSHAQLGDGLVRPPLLSCWSKEKLKLSPVLADIQLALDASSDQGFQPDGRALVAKWLVDHPDPKYRAHPLALPATVIEKPTLPALRRLSHVTGGVVALQRLLEASGGWADWCQAAWTQLPDGEDRQNPFFAPQTLWAEELWPHIPEAVLGALAEKPPWPVMPWQAFSADNWQCYLRNTSQLPAEAFEYLPPALGSSAALSAARLRSLSGAEQLWLHLEEEAHRALLASLKGQQWQDALLWLQSAPEPLPEALLSDCEQRVEKSDISEPVLLLLRPWLHSRLRRRPPEWRRLYALLSDIEERRARVQRARG